MKKYGILLGGFLATFLLLVGIAGATDTADNQIIVNGEDVTTQYIEDAEKITGSLVISATNTYWVDAGVKAYLPQIIEGYNIYVTDANGYPQATYSFPVTATVGEPVEDMAITETNTAIVDAMVTDNGIVVSTSGEGEGKLMFTGVKRRYYMIQESDGEPVYGEIIDGSFTHTFTQSEHTFEISVGDESFEPAQPVYGKIVLNGVDVTDEYVEDQSLLKGNLVINTNDYYMITGWVDAYLPQLEQGYTIYVQSYYGRSSVTYSFATSACVI